MHLHSFDICQFIGKFTHTKNKVQSPPDINLLSLLLCYLLDTCFVSNDSCLKPVSHVNHHFVIDTVGKLLSQLSSLRICEQTFFFRAVKLADDITTIALSGNTEKLCESLRINIFHKSSVADIFYEYHRTVLEVFQSYCTSKNIFIYSHRPCSVYLYN